MQLSTPGNKNQFLECRSQSRAIKVDFEDATTGWNCQPLYILIRQDITVACDFPLDNLYKDRCMGASHMLEEIQPF